MEFTQSLITHAVAGGLASVAGGGKFANGAVTAAFGYLFNEMGNHAQRGYEPTYYTGGTVVCNGGAYPGDCGLVPNIQNTWIIEETAATLFGVGSLIRAGWAAFTGAAAVDYSALSIAELKEIIGPGTNQLFRELWGTRAEGAAATLAQESIVVPQGLSTAHLLAYREIATRQAGVPVQDLRVRIIDRILGSR
jgi:hypothetical protein